MLRAAALATILAALALPAAAQQATPSSGIDWSKPVVGVDGNIPQARAEDAPLPVEVFTVEDLKVSDSPAKKFVDPLSKPAAPSCDPERRPSADGKSEVLSVCPAEPPARAQ